MTRREAEFLNFVRDGRTSGATTIISCLMKDFGDPQFKERLTCLGHPAAYANRAWLDALALLVLRELQSEFSWDAVLHVIPPPKTKSGDISTEARRTWIDLRALAPREFRDDYAVACAAKDRFATNAVLIGSKYFVLSADQPREADGASSALFDRWYSAKLQRERLLLNNGKRPLKLDAIVDSTMRFPCRPFPAASAENAVLVIEYLSAKRRARHHGLVGNTKPVDQKIMENEDADDRNAVLPPSGRATRFIEVGTRDLNCFDVSLRPGTLWQPLLAGGDDETTVAALACTWVEAESLIGRIDRSLANNR